MKKSHSLFVACLLVLCAHAAPASAQRRKDARRTPATVVVADPTAFAPDATSLVEGIFARYMEAQGGRARLASVKTRIMRGTVTHSRSEMPGTLEYYTKAPDRALTLVELPGVGQFISAYDGRDDWMSNPLTGALTSGHAPVRIFDRGSEFGRMPKASEMYSSVAYKGTARVGGREAHVVAAARRGEMTQLHYFDRATGLLVRSVVGVRDGLTREETPVTLNYGNYAKVDGIMIPTTLEQIFPAFTLTFKVYEIKHDVHIDDSMFERPAARAGN